VTEHQTITAARAMSDRSTSPMRERAMRVLVLGGTYFIGPHVVRRLTDGGYDVTVFHRGQHESDLTASARHVHGDFADFDRFVPDLRALRPDVVLDMVPFRAEHGRRVHTFTGVARRAVALSSADVYRAYGRLWRTEPGEPDPVPSRKTRRSARSSAMRGSRTTRQASSAR
jgi:hypothetical protein